MEVCCRRIKREPPVFEAHELTSNAGFEKADLLQQHEYFLVQIDGRTKSGHRRFIEASRAGLQLRDRFPHHDIKVRAIDEAVQRTVLH
jgi:hypothetical protein